MESQTETRNMEVEVTTYTVGGAVVGAVYTIPAPSAQLFLAEAHDWEGETNHSATHPAYDPITVGVFADPEQAWREIEERAEMGTTVAP